MSHYKYLIVGGGMTADAAIDGIRQVDPEGAIGLISAEARPPYNRPPLTKGLWQGKPVDKIWRGTPQKAGVSLHLGRTVKELDPAGKRVVDDHGQVYTFDKLLLATGGTPRRLPFGGEEIIYYRTVADYERLRTLTEQGQHFAVIGGGFIGSEIAASLAMNGKTVTMVFPESGIGERLFPADLVQFLNDYYRQKGVELWTGATLTGLEKSGQRWVLKTRAGQNGGEREVVVDGIVAGLGIQPNVELAQAAGLATDNGILVNAALQTSQPDIYAAGDAASFYNPTLATRLRVEHEDNANTMGRLAGQGMAGQPGSYDYLPFFYSDMFELGYEAVGELDSRLETVADWQEPHRKGVVYYLRAGRVRGVLLWNVWDQVPAAREVIAQPGPLRPADLRGKLPA